MFTFFKKREPPPPPKPTFPHWVNITVPIIFAVILGLLGLVYNSLAEDVKRKADQTTIEQMLINQRQVIDHNQQVLDKQQENIEKQQQTLEKTLHVIIELQTEQRVLKEKISAPSVSMPQYKKSISPKEFKEYMELTSEERQLFRELNPEYGHLP